LTKAIEEFQGGDKQEIMDPMQDVAQTTKRMVSVNHIPNIGGDDSYRGFHFTICMTGDCGWQRHHFRKAAVEELFSKVYGFAIYHAAATLCHASHR
jgi:hypothetical protein